MHAPFLIVTTDLTYEGAPETFLILAYASGRMHIHFPSGQKLICTPPQQKTLTEIEHDAKVMVQDFAHALFKERVNGIHSNHFRCSIHKTPTEALADSTVALFRAWVKGIDGLQEVHYPPQPTEPTKEKQ